MLRRVALVGTDVSEELSASISGVRRLLVTAKAPSSPILVTLMMEALSSSGTSVLTIATRRNIPEDAILNILIVWILGTLMADTSTTRSRHNYRRAPYGNRTGKRDGMLGYSTQLFNLQPLNTVRQANVR
jgi:hypothetical protein